ncbi:uncharacterized protein TRIVIDRAFT_38063 [Trichoderma virens Gv29-8]|uniref:Uncharacterized protein n=1 Tax=Hypocrea virens (strain Gv29-8 / FGSC 10586) TaxID=413071 RepID=G9NDH2_HYPVG|nr:uncharacterized protein TRIVIDRAFT_38063 [Trichoderma virens Gv29-8]EHK15739.1 hypothetical protein TRIVIDRAFT_38063 [Trichoderma virens Gv29-8]UKZ51683.1 hypothetical protein TrVGV298_005445 [Trichoderma virens]
MPAATARPKLGKLSTPVTSTFPSDIHSASTITPKSALTFAYKPDPSYIKTPISPPLAYTDFLSKALSLNSPALAPGEISPDSAPTSAVSDKSETSSTDERPSPVSSAASSKPSSPASATAVPPTPFTAPLPMSAPPTGANCFPSLKVPPSPAISNLDSPLSSRLIGSPFSARSIHSVFDWDAALKARLGEVKKQKSSRVSVRHIREVVTRTVTYTPKMDPAPRGKRRKVE